MELSTKNYSFYDAINELDKLNEEADYDDFDIRWEKEFGDTDQVIIMSAEDTIKQLRAMEKFE